MYGVLGCRKWARLGEGGHGKCMCVVLGVLDGWEMECSGGQGTQCVCSDGW